MFVTLSLVFYLSISVLPSSLAFLATFFILLGIYWAFFLVRRVLAKANVYEDLTITGNER